jgi:hypothetical protein
MNLIVRWREVVVVATLFFNCLFLGRGIANLEVCVSAHSMIYAIAALIKPPNVRDDEFAFFV